MEREDVDEESESEGDVVDSTGRSDDEEDDETGSFEGESIIDVVVEEEEELDDEEEEGSDLGGSLGLLRALMTTPSSRMRTISPWVTRERLEK